MRNKYLSRLDIEGRVCIVTGGGGLLGTKHMEAILEGGGIPVLLDISRGGQNAQNPGQGKNMALKRKRPWRFLKRISRTGTVCAG